MSVYRTIGPLVFSPNTIDDLSGATSLEICYESVEQPAVLHVLHPTVCFVGFAMETIHIWMTKLC